MKTLQCFLAYALVVPFFVFSYRSTTATAAEIVCPNCGDTNSNCKKDNSPSVAGTIDADSSSDANRCPSLLSDAANYTELCHEIVETTRIDPSQEVACKNILNELSPSELEGVAQSSYAYWRDSTNSNDKLLFQSGMALREIARYYDAAKQDFSLTLSALRKTCHWRNEIRLDLIRSCIMMDGDTSSSILQSCNNNNNNNNNNRDDRSMSNDDTTIAEDYRCRISKELESQPMTIKAGVTGRGVLYIGTRSAPESNRDDFVLAVIYSIERACATTEILSLGKETQLDVVIDAGGKSAGHSPSRATLKELVSILQNQYPNRLKTFVVLDPPFWLATLWSLISTFVDHRTREKFQLARGAKAKESTLRNIVKSSSFETDEYVIS